MGVTPCKDKSSKSSTTERSNTAGLVELVYTAFLNSADFGHASSSLAPRTKRECIESLELELIYPVLGQDPTPSGH